MQSLAEGAAAAHRVGLALSIDHASRVRISTEGDAVLAFPATMPGATTEGDLRGLGGTLYGLLLNRWPFADPDSTWGPVKSIGSRRPEEPAAIDPRIPFVISATADGLVREDAGIRSAATVLALLRQARSEAQVSAADGLISRPPTLPPPGGYASFRDFGPTQQTEEARNRILKTCLGIAAAVLVVLLLIAASTFNRIVGGDSDLESTESKLGLQPSAPSSRQAQETEAPPAAPVSAMQPVGASVFSPGGGADNPDSAKLAIDGDPATAWSTDTYHDAVPFPTFKEGIGLLVQLPKPISLSAVTVDLNSTGTVVQIRSSPSATPGRLDETAELTPPTPMQPGHNNIPVTDAAPATHIVVWISTLGASDGKSRTSVSEITVVGS
jgi:hypothetical protein